MARIARETERRTFRSWLAWATDMPVRALVVLAVSWGRYPPPCSPC